MQEDDLSSQNNRPERIVYIDVARGIAALLVVIGHSIQVADSTFDENILFRMIYSFHMPLFMFLSGYVSYKSEYFDRLWIIKKAKHLVVPFLVWTVLPVLFSGNSGDMFGKLYMAIKQPDVSYWFLLILFYCDVLLFAQNEIENALNKCIFKLNKPNAIINEALTNNFFGGALLTTGIISLVKISSFSYHEFGLALLSWHCIFFFAGYWMRRLSVSAKAQKVAFLILAILWIPLVCSWSRIRLPDYILLFSTHMNQWRFERLASVFNYIVAFAGIGFSILVALLFCRLQVVEKTLSEIGVLTVEMYLMQGLFYNIIRTPFTILNVICNVVLGVTMPLVICHLIKQKRMTMLFFGKRFKAK